MKEKTIYYRTSKYTYDYNVDIKDERWIAKSLLLRKNANYICERCGCKGRVVVHHSYYLDGLHLWDYPDEALMVLCMNCHAMEHNNEINPCEKVVEAMDKGVTKGDIIDCLDNLISDKGVFIPIGAVIPAKKGLRQNLTDKQRNQSVLTEFLSELKRYTNKYDDDYITSFIEYYCKKDSKGKYVFEPLTKFEYEENLQKWEQKKRLIFFDEKSKVAEVQAEEAWRKYFKNVKESIFYSINVNRELFDECYFQLEEQYKNLTDVESVCIKDIIPNFQNKKSSLKAYVDKRGLPNIYMELFRNRVLDEISSINPKGNEKVYIWKNKRYLDINASIDLKRIEVIENYIGFQLLKQPIFIRNVHYCQDCISYVKRYVLKELIQCDWGIQYFMEYWIRKNEYLNASNKIEMDVFNLPNISMDDFKFVYTINLMQRLNSISIINKIKRLDKTILLDDFCKENGVELLNVKPNQTLKLYLERKIKSYDPEMSFQPVIVDVGVASLYFYNQEIDIPQDLMRALNEKMDFCFVPYKLNNSHQKHKFVKFYETANGCYISNSVFYQEQWVPPFEILTAMDGCEFDFTCERFVKAKMQSITLSEDLSFDLYEKLVLLDRKIEEKERVGVEAWKKNYEKEHSCKLR